MKIVFGIMSAVQSAETVASLVDALGTRHPILIHHDWSQQPDFSLRRANVAYVDQPCRTGWADWGFSQGILKLVRTALEGYDLDYLQLLSPTCMPIRPIQQFEAHLAREGADYHVDAANLATDPFFLMSHGWRGYAAEGTLRHRMLRRSRKWYLGLGADVVDRAGLSFPVSSARGEGGVVALKAMIGLGLTNLAKRGMGFDHPFSGEFQCFAGSTWFGASRRGCEYLLRSSQDDRLMGYFARMHMADEMFFPSVFKNSDLMGTHANHYIARFIDARPSWLQMSDLDQVLNSDRFFARKFPEDPASEVRIALAQRLLHQAQEDEQRLQEDFNFSTSVAVDVPARKASS